MSDPSHQKIHAFGEDIFSQKKPPANHVSSGFKYPGGVARTSRGGGSAPMTRARGARRC
jgi:hypothetical protein